MWNLYYIELHCVKTVLGSLKGCGAQDEAVSAPLLKIITSRKISNLVNCI